MKVYVFIPELFWVDSSLLLGIRGIVLLCSVNRPLSCCASVTRVDSKLSLYHVLSTIPQRRFTFWNDLYSTMFCWTKNMTFGKVAVNHSTILNYECRMTDHCLWKVSHWLTSQVWFRTNGTYAQNCCLLDDKYANTFFNIICEWSSDTDIFLIFALDVRL